MGRQRFTVENIVRKLREAEVELSRGQTVSQVSKKLGVCAINSLSKVTANRCK